MTSTVNYEARSAFMADEKDDTTPYVVLMNIEEQYSLMPKSISTVPNGWKVVKEGTRAECGAYVNEVWTDMRPLSLRKHMQEFAERKRQQQAAQQAAPAPSEQQQGEQPAP